MDIQTAKPVEAETSADTGTKRWPNERRRPGRVAASPALLDMLRGSRTFAAIDDFEHEAGLAAARGIAVGVVLGLPCWGAIAMAAHWAIG